MDTRQDQALAVPRLGRYEIDPEGSTVRFTTRHLFGLLPVHGTFALRGGTLDVAEPLARSGVRVEVDAASIDSGSAQRDGAVRSARFLDTSRHPVMVFVSEGPAGSTLRGTLTVCGVTRPVSLAIERSTLSQDGFTVLATTRIDRTAFGVTAARGMAGRRLALSLEVSWVRR
ncbi:YceI family protein [Streptacidiphilus griseoplanus]|uniref:YceI family protein n=1 Tax=Peterkaempfera griseoplana TaxID=66896 RepID=UPI0006E396D4|nr:YceI family protein [Peterkaempfera griseoplana]